MSHACHSLKNRFLTSPFDLHGFLSAQTKSYLLLISKFSWSSWWCAITWYLSFLTFPYQYNSWKTFLLLRFNSRVKESSAFQSSAKKLPLLKLEIDLFLLLTYKDWVYFWKCRGTAGKECWWYRKVSVEMHHRPEEHCLVPDMVFCHIMFPVPFKRSLMLRNRILV